MSAQSIYAAQTGINRSSGAAAGMIITTKGVGPVIMGTRSAGSQASNLALQLAPPSAPQRTLLLGCGVIGFALVLAAMGVTGLALALPSNGFTAHTRDNGLIFMVLSIGLLSALFLAIFLRRRVLERRRIAHTAIWLQLMRVWESAMVCLRCHGVFFPAGSPYMGSDPGGFIPVSSFRAVITDIGTRLAAANPV